MTLPIALTRRGWGLLIGAAALWAAWLVIGIRDIWYLIAMLVALLLLGISAALVLPALARFEVALSPTDPTPTAGETVRLTALVRHRARSALRCRALWSIAGRRDATPLQVDPGEPALAQRGWEAIGRGPVRARVSAITVFDPLGFIARNVRAGAETELLVLPRTLPALSELLRDAGRVSGTGSSSGTRMWRSDSGAPAGSVRDYRSGDSLRQIHWKQTARQGELLVKLHETASSASRSLLLVTASDAYADDDDFELAVAAAATLGSLWLRDGHLVELRLEAGRPLLCASEGELLRALSHVQLRHDDRTAPASDLASAPQAVVTGELDERLALELARLGRGGLLLARRRRIGAAAPMEWSFIGIPGPAASAERAAEAAEAPEG
ncbi:DUF58 domain-containing protein [Leucobacter weissii]|uniref:DUF58 domain-containing protein n=1 Tax=Leucobacter weissii TaxID=1983706 RepID=A0A939S8Z5_9MICO|nr:DUF58 domain-containing protein [Leucobacter weissii]MBO1902621.1 DUF58 domain-containing protein [Leucobacter weissii]